mmetsp:Transcript_11754/g.16122  ORF Transcript_11754/g.16122 Transcript_11754/m.16122 type:complete len:1046 (+) Transcript_11754:30-3167(+)
MSTSNYLLDFDSSLPSQSKFVSDDELTSNWNTRLRSLSPSPPPPPPENDVFEVDTSNFPSNQPPGERNEITTSGKDKKPLNSAFPFLKKRSRKEPSAKYAKKAEEVQTKSTEHHNNESDVKQKVKYRNAGKKFDDEGEEILLRGSGYWGLNSSIIKEIPVEDVKAAPEVNNRASLSSSSSIRVNHNIAMGVANFHKELEEFEQIERELERLTFNDATLTGSEEERINTYRGVSVETDLESSSRPLTKSLNLTNDDRVNMHSWGAVTQPIPPISSSSFLADHSPSPMQSDNSLSYTSSYETKLRMSATHSLSPRNNTTISNLNNNNNSNSNSIDKNYSTSINAMSHYSENDKYRGSQNEVSHPKSNDITDNVNIIRTRPMSATRSFGDKTDMKLNKPPPLANSQTSSNARQINGSTTAVHNDGIPSILALKAKELEAELDTYRNENSNLKKLRKQQELALAEVVQQKEQVISWAASEKQKTLDWCEEQKQQIAKEKRAMAKMAKDSKERSTSSSTTIRKEKIEIEGLQATICKMKLDHEAAAKKWKTNENRMYSLMKDHSKHIEDLDKKVATLEEDKLLLLEFIQESDLHIPKDLRTRLQNSFLQVSLAGKTTKGSSSSTPSSSVVNRKTATSAHSSSYRQEVDVEEVITGTANRIDNYQDGSRKGGTTPKKSHTISLDRPTRLHPPNNLNHATATSGSLRLSGRDKSPHQTLAARTSTTSTWSHSSGRYSSEEVDLNENNDNFSTDFAGTALIEEDKRDGWRERYPSQRPTEVHTKSSSITTDTRLSPHKSIGNPSIGSYVDTASNNNRFNRPPNSIETLPSNSKDKFGNSSIHNFDNEQYLTVNSDLQLQTSSRMQASSSNGIKSESTPLQPKPTPLQPNINNSNQQQPPQLQQLANNTKNTAINNNTGRVEETLSSGGKLIRYSNGTTKEVSADGLHSIVRFTNGDFKQTDSSNGSLVVVYYYKLADTTHTTFQDGTELYEFPNKQVEKHHPSGVKEIFFPDSTRKVIKPDGIEESYFADGVVLREFPDGRKEVMDKNGVLKS